MAARDHDLCYLRCCYKPPRIYADLANWTLRRAAREIATGNLNARVSWVRLSKDGKLGKGDEIQGLMFDFNEMASRLEALVNAQRLLLRDVSHELRSPLSRLNVALELGREEATGTMHVHLDRIEREALRLNNLIGQLMALSHGNNP
jgi:two-component system, OmpR family, sensor histidine kinase CpxA